MWYLRICVNIHHINMYLQGIVQWIEAPCSLSNLIQKSENSFNSQVSKHTSWQHTCVLYKLSAEEEIIPLYNTPQGFPIGSGVKNSAANAGDSGLIYNWDDPLEKEMAAHSSILTWKMLWTEEPGGLESIGSQKSQTWINN